MKKILRTILPAVLLMTFLSGSAMAQTKIATVDLRKLFDGYWKTKQAQADIQTRKSQLDKDDKAMRDDFKKAGDDYQQSLAKANDQVISADERARRKQDAADKLKQLQDRKAQIDSYENEATTRLHDQLQRMSQKILVDIKVAVNDKAKAGGYTIVLNTADDEINLGSANISVPSPVIYSNSENDLTDAVLKQLNAGAPIDTTAPAATTPAPSLLGTNSP